MANRCFFYAADSAADSISLDSDKVMSIRTTDSTTVVIDYQDSGGAAKKITLGTTEAKTASVVQNIGRLVVAGRGVVTLADDVNKIYGIDGIEEVDSITHA